MNASCGRKGRAKPACFPHTVTALSAKREAWRDFLRRQRSSLSIRKVRARQNFALSSRRQEHQTTYISTMAQRAAVKTTYEVNSTLQPIYSGGALSLSEDGRILAASLGEDVLLTDLTNGKELGRIEGDGEAITALACEWDCTRKVLVVDME
jgi:hypothetical protein